KAGSFSSGESYTMESHPIWETALNFYRGCTNELIFTRTDDSNLDQDVEIVLIIEGTAVEGVDYSPLPENLVIPAGQSTLVVPIDAYPDATAIGVVTMEFIFSNGCPCSLETSTNIVYIHPGFGINPTIANNGPICVGDDAEFEIDLNQSGQESEVQIIWSTGHTDVTSVTITPTETTTVTASIIYPCDTVVITSTITVVNPPEIDLPDDFEISGLTAPLQAFPAQGNTGEWTYVAGSGPGNATIGSPTSPNTTATIDEFGTYAYIWTETNLPPNCFSSDTLFITYYHIPTTDFYITPVDCYGDTAVITYLGNGFEWATYEWDFGDGVVISGNHWGPYQVRWDQPGAHNVSLQIAELNAVVDTTLQVFIPQALTYTTDYSDDPCFQSCNGYARVNASGGTPPYNYNWGSSTNEMTNLCSGQYTITVNDVNACSFTHQFIIDEPTQLEYDTVYGNVDCYGNATGWAEVIPNGGTPPYTCMWSDGYIGNHHANLTAGTYTVTISDSNGCSLFEMFKITQPNLLQVAVSPSLAICENTTIVASAQAMGGTLPYQYFWDSGDGYDQDVPSFQITPHADVTYNIYVVDAHNCVTEPQTIEITVSPTMSHEFDLEHVKCYGECNGRAEINIQGGISPFSYSWASPNHIITGLCEGVHTLTVTDNIGCNFQTHFVINQPSELVGTTSTSGTSCFGATDGTANINVSGGTMPYTYLWPNNSNTNEMTNTAGTYTVSVTDANNCRIEETVVITQPNELVIQPSSDKTICIGGTTRVSAQSAGGTGYTSFYWEGSDGSTWNTHLFDASPTETTTYHLTVTDDNGCTATEQVTISLYPELEIENILTNHDTLCVG
ncbi:MAG: hypothetical protein GX879_11980, partial [Bacteroidales bacterium]|nr:hypothetical protein [Bacteroidales bacterium]